MSVSASRIVFTLLFLLGITIAASAQPARRDSISWSEFVEIFFEDDDATEDMDATERLAVYEQLEELHVSPLNLNTCSREDLLQLPFISSHQADAIVQYRDKRAFLSLGELLLIPSLSYAERLYLPLFVYIGERETARPSLIQQLTQGKYELSTQLDVPLYTREGNRAHTASELARYPNRVYYGNGLRNVVRMRYKYGKTWAYGFTLEKDAGEPFAAQGNKPYDYASFFVHHQGQNAEWIVGDYNISAGQGLLFGNGFLLGRTMLANSAVQNRFRIKAHTATEENNFFRGIATRFSFGRFETALFLSYRSLDASFSNDTIRTLQTTGLHRTQAELTRKDYAKAFSAGAHASYQTSSFALGLTAYATQYTQPVSPTPQYYNAGYFRGRRAMGLSADYTYHTARWDIGGEAAFDHKLHMAYTALIRFKATDELHLFFQHRHLSSRFVSLYGHIVSEASRTVNEHGAIIGGTAQMGRRLVLTSYIDAFVLPAPTYLNHQRTRGLAAYLRADYKVNRLATAQFTYRFKTKERGITGHNELTQFVNTHRATARLTLQRDKFSLIPMLTASLRMPQWGENAWGWMAAIRSAWQIGKGIKCGGFASVFMSDDYQSALYAYEPQLLYQGGIPSFYYHGMRLALTVTAHLLWGIEGGIKVGSTHYFNRNEISSSTQLIRSSWKNDISLQLRWRIQPRKKTHSQRHRS